MRTKPCDVCGGSGWKPTAKGTGYDDVCDHCIAGEVADDSPPSANDIAELVENALELADLMDEVRAGVYKPDSFTTQLIRQTLKKFGVGDASKCRFESHEA